MRLIAVIIFITFMIQDIVSAQNMEVLRGSKIELNGNIYDFYESEELFKEVPISYHIYIKAKRAKRASKGWGYSSLASLGMGILLIKSPDLEGYCGGLICLTSAQLLGVLTTFVVFPVTGTIAIISSANSNARLKKAAVFYNSNRDLGYTQKEDIKISFGLSQNGIGLVLNF